MFLLAFIDSLTISQTALVQQHSLQPTNMLSDVYEILFSVRVDTHDALKDDTALDLHKTIFATPLQVPKLTKHLSHSTCMTRKMADNGLSHNMLQALHEKYSLNQLHWCQPRPRSLIRVPLIVFALSCCF